MILRDPKDVRMSKGWFFNVLEVPIFSIPDLTECIRMCEVGGLSFQIVDNKAITRGPSALYAIAVATEATPAQVLEFKRLRNLPVDRYPLLPDPDDQVEPSI